jgi:hypothetical protein
MNSLMRPALAAAVAVAAAGAMSPALAGDPAVSTLNFKVTAEGGRAADEDAWLGLAQVTAPLGHAWGVQGEAGIFDVDGETAYGLAGHAFTRDPARYLVGAFGAWAHADGLDVDVGRVGVEGEYYLEHLTFLANTGYQFGDGFIDDTWFGEAQVGWYANNNFLVTGGVAFDDETAVTHVGAEWLVGTGSSLPGLALRGDVHVGDNDYSSGMVGFTYYFGPDANLKDRHRKQDPDSALFDLLHAVESSCEEPAQQQRAAKVAEPIFEPIAACGQIVYLPPN